MGRTRDVSKILTSNTSILTLASASTTYATKASTGLTLINTTSFTGQSTVSIDNVFSATYERYLIKPNVDGSANASLRLRLRVSGSDNTASNYRTQFIDASLTNLTASRSTGQTSFFAGRVFGDVANIYPFNHIELLNPFQSTYTTAHSISNDSVTGNLAFYNTTMNIDVTTSYTGFTIFPESGTFEGSVSTYGYNK
jgi:hypothetical protein